MKQNTKKLIAFKIFVVVFMVLSLITAADLPFHPNIKINYNLEPTSEEEITIAIHGPHLVGGWHYALDDHTGSSTLALCAVAYSHDSGATWHNSILTLPSGFSDSCDPAVCCNQDGVFYYAQLGLNFDVSDETGVFVSRSNDFGVNWTTPVDVTSGSIPTGADGAVFRLVDKEWIAAEGDNVFVSFGDLKTLLGIFPIEGNIRFARSTDRGNTFGTVLTLNSSGICNLSMPACDDSGNVYVFWRNFSDDKFYMAHSSDHGASFGAQQQVVSFADPSEEPGFRVMAMPIVEVNPTNGHIYLVWVDGSTPGDPANIMFIYSIDQGANWSTPMVVNNDAAGKGQWFPWIDVDAGGTVHVVWYDERNNTGALGENLDLYYATFNDGDGSFGANVRVTDTCFEVVFPHEADIVKDFIGDYIGVAYGTRPHPAWMDSRSGNQDVFSTGYTETLPVRVQAVQVLDVSGSMGWESSVPGISKISAVKEDAGIFLDLLRDGSGGAPQDEMGMVQYSGSVIDFTAPGLPTVEYIPLTAIEDTTFRPNAHSYIDNMTDHSSTSIARGLQKAQDEFDASGAADAAHMVLLLSDGHETSGPYVDENLINDLLGRSIRCFTLGYGTDPYIDEPLLSDIALKTGGDYHYVDSDGPLEVRKQYIGALTSILDAFIVADPIEEIGGGDEAKYYDAHVVEPDNVVTFILNWEHPQVNLLNLTLITPGEREINPEAASADPAIEFKSGSTYQFYRLRFPLSGQMAKEKIGLWHLVVNPGSLAAGKTERFATSTTVDSNLRLDVSFDKDKYATGDRITLRARLSQDGQPITANQVDKISALSNVPLTGLGNFLSKNKLTPAEAKKMQDYLRKDADLDPKAAKLKVLLERDWPAKQFPRADRTLPLFDDGMHNDGAANDGIFANWFTTTETPGSYTFEVQAELYSLGKHFTTRQKTVSLYDKVNIDGEESMVDITPVTLPDPIQGKTGYKVDIVPKDRFGNYLGPGFSHLIKLNSTMGDFHPLVDNNDGSYSALLAVADKRRARITVNVDGIRFKTQPVASPQEGPPESRPLFSLHLGAALPLGTFANNYKAGFNLVADFEHPLTANFSLRALLGYNQFRAKITGAADTSIFNLNANLRYCGAGGTISFFAEAGPGFYILEHSPDKFGLNLGWGVWYGLTPKIGLEFAAHYHSIFTNPDRTQFLHLAGGVTIRL